MKVSIVLLYVMMLADVTWCSENKMENMSKFNNDTDENLNFGSVINTQPPECIICFRHFPLIMQNVCGHGVCGLCFEELFITEDNKKCPLCRKVYTGNQDDFKRIVYKLPSSIQSLEDVKNELNNLCQNEDIHEIQQWVTSIDLNTKSLPKVLQKIYTTKQWMQKGLNPTKIKDLLDLQKVLPFVCQIGQINTIKIWMALGLDANLEGIFGFYPIHLCTKRTVIKYLEIAKNADMKIGRNIYGKLTSGFLISCRLGHLEVAKYWIEKGENVNQIDANDISPLVGCCILGELKTIQFLIHHGADVNLAAADDTTPLMISSAKNNIDVVTYLIEHGAIVNQSNLKGNTALHSCCVFPNLESIKCLIKNGADASLTNKEDTTPLIISCQEGHFDNVKFLLENEKGRTTINKANIFGSYPLYIGCHEGFLKIVQTLIDHGAQIYKTNWLGLSALDIARIQNQSEVVTYLQEVIAGKYGHHFCAVCKEIANLRCSSCKLIWYCGQLHQKDHWKIHKANCNKNFNIKNMKNLKIF